MAAYDPGADFEAAYLAAEEAGVNAQALFESQIARNLRMGNLEALIRNAPNLPGLRDELEYGSEWLFISPMDYEAFVEAIYARRAYAEGNIREFGAYARNSYWKGPQWVQLLGVTALVQEERDKEETMRHLQDVQFPFNRRVETVDGERIPLSELMEGKKALMLELWGSWCEPCIRGFSLLRQRAEALRPHGVVVAGLNVDEENQLSHAERFRELHNMQMPWLLDPVGEDSLSLLLRVGTVPRVALIDAEGSILFVGLPNDPQLVRLLEGFMEAEEAEAAE